MSTPTWHQMNAYRTKGWDIVGYTFDADVFCPRHIIDALPTGEGGAFDGWKEITPANEEPKTVEENLDEIAAAFGIDRQDERTFDSGDFPKVILNSQVESDDERCATCHEPLVDND